LITQVCNINPNSVSQWNVRQTFMSSNSCTEVKNALDGIAFMSGEGQLILLGEIEFSNYLVRALNKFDLRLIIQLKT
jgi:hypothetical protein